MPPSLSRRAFLPLLLLLLTVGCGHRPPTMDRAELGRQLDAALSKLGHTGATYSARVIDLSTRQELYAVNPDEPYIPASNMKVPVSAAALDRLGPKHTFKTYLALDGDDLWVLGTGDPATGDPRIAKDANRSSMAMFDAWAHALKAKGITKVTGNLYFYDGVFDDQRVLPLWSRSFLTDWYAAPVSGLNFNDNCIDVKVKPAKPGKPADYTVMPPKADFEIVNKTVTSSSDHKPEISREQDSNRFTLTGPVSREAEVESKPITDPGRFFAEAFRAHLASKGIEIAGQTERAPSPLDGNIVPISSKLVAVHESKMDDVLRRINKNSQNLFAEAICKYLGREHLLSHGTDSNPKGSWESGGLAVRQFLQRRNISDSGFTIADGSGLARQNRVTTRLMSDLLVTMHDHPHGKPFHASLSIAGKDGTLAKRLPDSDGRLHAKTGYISGVRALSGYVKTDSGRTLAFSIIFNDIPGPVKPYEELQDDACRILMKW